MLTMCNKRNSVKRKIRGKIVRLDSCVAPTVMNYNKHGLRTVASCCGHGVYDWSIIIRSDDGTFYDALTAQQFPKGRKHFYTMDSKGFYHLIPGGHI